ncbi:MAG: WcaF family extracellular polysaccharide biosynthesis acetyltransferase [Paludibacter sp.]|nr:WcaF family extracellular polysaccharide biosynthesis acetyltransferase [Paludibacter sp.]
MSEKIIDLSKFDSRGYNKGAGTIKILLWYFVNTLFVRPAWNPIMCSKFFLLRIFGAKLGKNICLKPGVIIKSPWYLVVGDNSWIGENVWIDNLDRVTIGSNVCISQGAMLLTGNHDYTDRFMPYRNAPIILEDGVWIGAQAVVTSGVTAFSCSILTVGSIATKDMQANEIYQGNPAIKIRERILK